MGPFEYIVGKLTEIPEVSLERASKIVRQALQEYAMNFEKGAMVATDVIKKELSGIENIEEYIDSCKIELFLELAIGTSFESIPLSFKEEN